MQEPIQIVASEGAAHSYVGINTLLLLAGLAGGVVSLSYIKPLNKIQACTAVLSGALMANYLTPLALWWAKIPQEFELGAGFLIGLTGMHLVPLILGRVKAKSNQSNGA